MQLTFDLLNALNLLNGDWGRIDSLTDPTIPLIRFRGRDAQCPGVCPVSPEDPMTVTYAGPVCRGAWGAEPALPYSPAVPGSQWQAQGIRVSF